MIKLTRRFFEIARERGLKDALSTTKSYLLFELPDSFLWTPLTRYIYSKYEKIDRSELRETAEITVETETEFIPFKSILGAPTREKQIFYKKNMKGPSAEIPTGKTQGYYKPNSRFISSVGKAKIKGKYGLFVDSENRIINEAIGPQNLQPFSTNNVLKQALQELNISFNQSTEMEMDLITPLTITHGGAYYHWIIEALPKIFMTEKYGEKTGSYPDLLVRQDREKFMDESLEIIDYPGDIRYWSGGVAEINKLLVPTYPDPVVEEIEWLRDRMIENSEDLDIGKEKILVTRQDANSRQIQNFKEIKKELSKLGFEAVTPGEHTIEEQVNIFKDAEIIVGVHGAGLTNIVYAKNAKVIEIVGKNKNHASFLRISYILNHDYDRIYCENVGENIKVDLKRLKNLLN